MGSVVAYPTGNALPARTNSTYDSEKVGGYYTVEKLRRQYTDFLGAKTNEIDEAKEARRYYHGSQWTSEELASLAQRKQAPRTDNITARKIDAVVGLVERLRQDPKAFPRTPREDDGAEIATAAIRYVLDMGDWKSKSPRVALQAAIEGIAGIEYDLQQGDQGDPEVVIHTVVGDTFFYDPRSYDPGFTDARYMGIAKWCDVEVAKELVPGKAAEIEQLVESGMGLGDLSSNSDREVAWINVNEKRVRLIDHWYICDSQWKWALYIGNTILMEGESPFIDEKKKSFPKFRCFSASVDHDGDRYGFVRNLKPLQDEVNHWHSKASYAALARRLIVDKGAVDDIEQARREWSRSDGLIEKNPGLEITPDAWQPELKAFIEFEKAARESIENFGPNPALIGQGLEDSSGRAIQLLQQAGIAELGPYLLSLKSHKIRVYRDIWNIIRKLWVGERWIRVTDDDNVPRLLQINGIQQDPNTGQTVRVNPIAALDVDIIIDESPDTINMQADNLSTLQQLGPQWAQQFPEEALELSPIYSTLKKKLLANMQQKRQEAMQQPNPEVQAEQAKLQIEMQKAEMDAKLKESQFALDFQKQQAEMQLKREIAEQDIQLEMFKVNAQIEAEQRKAQSQMELERMKAGNQLEIENAKASHQMQIEETSAAHSIENEGKKTEAKIESDKARAKSKEANKPKAAAK